MVFIGKHTIPIPAFPLKGKEKSGLRYPGSSRGKGYNSGSFPPPDAFP